MRPVILCSLLCALAVPISTEAQSWKFVVAGDGRSDPRNARAEDKNGINVKITTEVAHAVLQEKAKFLLWTGDLALGSKEPAVFETQLRTWRSIMQPLYSAKIPVLAVRGNHEMTCGESEKIWNRVFSGPYSMPRNGPFDQRNLSFYFGKGPVLAIGLDQYKLGKEMVDQDWLDSILAKYKKPFIFAFGHEQAFMDGTHKDTLDANPDRRDAFWESLIKAGSRVYFAGHDHLYDHMIVHRLGSDPGPEMHQMVAGTAGAPFYDQGDYAGNNANWVLKRVKHIDRTYGYIVVEVDGNRCTVTFKGRTAAGKYVPMDSFTITAG